MIQTISTPVGSHLQSALAASAGEVSSNSFMAMLSQALVGAEASEDAMGNPLSPALQGREGLDAVDATGAGGPTSTTREDATLLAMLGLPMPAMSAAGMAARPEIAKAADEPPGDVGVAIDGDYGRPDGKKLPNPLAVIAGQETTARLPARQEVGEAATAKSTPLLPVGGDVHAADPRLLAPSPAATRSQTTVGSPEKVAIGMRSDFGSEAWRQELGEKLVSMTGRQEQTVELILNPPSLGRVEVRLDGSGSNVGARFVSANPNVRDAIEAALPKLREMMAGSGAPVLTIDGADARPAGERLPNPPTLLAGRENNAQPPAPQAPVDAGSATSAPLLPVGPEARIADANLWALIPAREKLSTPSPTASPAAAPESGEETTWAATRSQTTVGSPEKVAIGMRSDFGSEAWRQELGEKLVSMTGRQEQTVELILNPPSLGRVEVRLDGSGSNVGARFVSANPNVREAIEAALPKLREMMAGSGAPVLTIDGADARPAGERLPDPPTLLAGRENNAQPPARPVSGNAAVSAESAPLLPVGPEARIADASLWALIPAREKLSTPSPAASPAAAAESGEETTGAATRSQTTVGSPEKVAIGMRSDFGSEAWRQELGEKPVSTTGRQEQTVELILNPPSLGRVEVRLDGSDSNVGARFASANPNVREAIEAALPKLREMMAGSGDPVLTIDGTDARPAGERLPNPPTLLAGRENNARLPAPQAPMDVVSAKSAPLLPVGGDAISSDASQLALTTALEKSSAPSPASSPAASPMSGQETAWVAARSQTTVEFPEKVMIGMRSDLGSAAWRQELGDKLVWMTGRQGQTAELILNPASLGVVEVRLNMSGSDASAQFFSANPNVRDAIEAALPKLREMMLGAGIELGNTSVSDQSFGQRDRAEQGKPGGQSRIAVANTTGSLPMAATERISTTALLDYFA